MAFQLKDIPLMTKLLGFQHSYIPRGSGWSYVFVYNSKTVTVGRFTFKDQDLYYWKSYKKTCVRYEIDETDFIFFRINRYLEDGYVMPKDVFDQLTKAAHKWVELDLKKKMQWRANHPKQGHTSGGNPKTRRGLVGKDPAYVLQRMVMEYKPEYDSMPS